MNYVRKLNSPNSESADMRLFVAGAVLDSRWKGGEPLVARYVTEGLSKLGVHVYTLGIIRQHMQVDYILGFARDINPLFFNLYRRYLKRIKPDLVLGFYDYDSSLNAAAQSLGIPFVTVIQNYWPVCPVWTLYIENKGICHGPAFKKCMQHFINADKLSLPIKTCEYFGLSRRTSILRNAANLVAPSKYVSELLSRFGLEDVHVIPNAVDIREIKFQEWVDNRKYVLNPTGYTTEYKGFSHFLDMARLLNRRNNDCAEFLAAGFRGQIRPVNGLGFLPRPQLLEAMKRSYLVVVPVLWGEPFGLAVTEAMASGRPVVAYASGAIPEIIADHKSGLLVSPGQVRELATAVETLLEDEEAAREMGREGRHIVERKFAVPQMVQTYYKLLKQSC